MSCSLLLPCMDNLCALLKVYACSSGKFLITLVQKIWQRWCLLHGGMIFSLGCIHTCKYTYLWVQIWIFDDKSEICPQTIYSNKKMQTLYTIHIANIQNSPWLQLPWKQGNLCMWARSDLSSWVELSFCWVIFLLQLFLWMFFCRPSGIHFKRHWCLF